jgi:hypothetical protein
LRAPRYRAAVEPKGLAQLHLCHDAILVNVDALHQVNDITTAGFDSEDTDAIDQLVVRDQAILVLVEDPHQVEDLLSLALIWVNLLPDLIKDAFDGIARLCAR